AELGPAWDSRLILLADLRFLDGSAAVRASSGQGSLQNLIDLLGRGTQAVAMATVGGTPLAAWRLGLGLGWSLGERCGLAFALPTDLFQLGAGLLQLLLQPFVVAAKLVVLLTQAVVVLTQLPQLGAQFLQLLQNGDGHRHRVADLDRRHRCLAGKHPLRRLLCESLAQTARGR